MYKVKIYSVGKNKEQWLQEALFEYEKRLTGTVQIEWVLCKTSGHLDSALEKQDHYICLTPEGKQYTSGGFSSAFIRWMQQYHSRLCFVIGGAEGISKGALQRADHTLSLSSLTFTHQITRLVLLEQIYRALEIDKGSDYHK